MKNALALVLGDRDPLEAPWDPGSRQQLAQHFRALKPSGDVDATTYVARMLEHTARGSRSGSVSRSYAWVIRGCVLRTGAGGAHPEDTPVGCLDDAELVVA
jgi:hypothetical protein